MIIYKQVGKEHFSQYDSVPMRVNVKSCYKIDKINGGLGGLAFAEVTVKPYVKDFCTEGDASAKKWCHQFDTTKWAFFMAFDGEKPVGGVTVASRTLEVNMLEGRDDLAVLWDIRVDDDYKRQGIGRKLFHIAAEWSRHQNFSQMKIECQNNNVPAIKFYHKQGAQLCAVDEYAYYNEPEFRQETQLIWYLNL